MFHLNSLLLAYPLGSCIFYCSSKCNQIISKKVEENLESRYLYAADGVTSLVSPEVRKEKGLCLKVDFSVLALQRKSQEPKHGDRDVTELW